VFDITQSMKRAGPAAGWAQRHAAGAREGRDGNCTRRAALCSKAGWAIFTEYRSFLLIAPIEVCAHQREAARRTASPGRPHGLGGNSEVAKGLNSGMLVVHTLPSRRRLVFLTARTRGATGQSALPANFALKRGEVRGMIVGVGGDTPRPIPKTDPSGLPLGEWGADEVLQVDPRSLGRGGSVAGEQMVEPEGPDGEAAARRRARQRASVVAAGGLPGTAGLRAGVAVPTVASDRS
jgi:mxaL protein